MRVNKDAIILYLLESANYSPESFMQSLESLILRRSDYQLLRLEKLIKEKLYGKGFLSASGGHGVKRDVYTR